MARAQDRVIWLICAVLVAPLLLVDVPPLLDYPNHLARLFVAAHADDPGLAAMYVPHWAVLPNLAVDLLGPPLLWLLPVHVAGRVLIGLAAVLPALGSIAYHRAVFRRRSWWPLASALVAYNAALVLGFLNFVIAIGLALLLAAAWIDGRDARPGRTLALGVAGGVLLFLCHLMGLAFFVVLVGTWQLEQAWRHGGVLRRGLELGAMLVLPAALFLASPLSQADGELGWLPLPAKLFQLMFPFLNYSFPLDVVTAVLVIGLVLLSLAARWAVLPLHAAASLGLLALLGAIAPFGYKGTYGLDVRFVIMLGFLTFAAIDLPELPARRMVQAMLGVLFAARMALLGLVWHVHATDVAALRQVIAAVPAGATVDVSTVTPEEAPAYWRGAPWGRRLSDGSTLDGHLAALLLIERRAFWPFLFADPAQQPVALRPRFQLLASSAQGMRPHRDVSGSVCGFDFLLLLDAGGEPDLAGYQPDRLALVRAGDVAALFRVLPCRR